MKVITALCLFFFLAACAQTIEEEREMEEPFHAAVESWVGANINDMVSAWGQPDEWQPYEGPDEPPKAYWEIVNIKGASMDGSAGASTRLERTCEAWVVADEADTILVAEAKTDRCVEFLHDRIADLRR